MPVDLFGTVYKSLHICTGPEDLGCIISYDTRTPKFAPEQVHNLGLGLAMWPHHMHWLLHDRYCAEPEGTDDVNKPRVQISPLTWSTAPGVVLSA